MRLEPIAIYRESSFERRCRFDLHEDSIRVVGTTFTGKFETTIPLTRLHPQFARQWQYPGLIWSGFFLFIIGCVWLLVILITHDGSLAPPAGPIGCITGVGLAMILFNLRKTEFVVFSSDAGVPSLAIGRIGKENATFDAFVTRLVGQIRTARREG
jgi:hypothetical protein